VLSELLISSSSLSSYLLYFYPLINSTTKPRPGTRRSWRSRSSALPPSPRRHVNIVILLLFVVVRYVCVLGVGPWGSMWSQFESVIVLRTCSLSLTHTNTNTHTPTPQQPNQRPPTGTGGERADQAAARGGESQGTQGGAAEAGGAGGGAAAGGGAVGAGALQGLLGVRLVVIM
jgi:uncharacterized membrane protein YgcG